MLLRPSTPIKMTTKNNDKFGLNTVLSEVMERMVRFQLMKTYTKAEYTDLTFKADWPDDKSYKLIISLKSESKKPVFKGDSAYSLSGYVYVKIKEALQNDESMKPGDVTAALDALKGREVRVNGEVVFSA
jgi:hypothetical protein